MNEQHLTNDDRWHQNELAANDTHENCEAVMAVNPVLQTRLGKCEPNRRARPRSEYLPRASVLDRLSEHERASILNSHRRMLRDEVARVVLTSHLGRAKFLKSARARLKRLDRLANSYGLWSEEGLSFGMV